MQRIGENPLCASVKCSVKLCVTNGRTVTVYRIIQVLLGLIGVVGLALAAWIGLEGDWLALVVWLPGIAAYGWRMRMR